jgi:hypothetical protein
MIQNINEDKYAEESAELLKNLFPDFSFKKKETEED